MTSNSHVRRRALDLPRFSPKTQVQPAFQLQLRNRKADSSDRRRRIRRQRYGDFFLGALFVLIGWVLAYWVAGIF